MENEIYKKVYIHSEADLPPKYGKYMTHAVGMGVHLVYFDSENKNKWGKLYDWYLLPLPLVRREKAGETTKEQIDLKELVIKERNKGNVVILTWEGPMMAELKSIIDQPTEGLLYDLNRDEGTILTLISDPKWVNDFACAQVIRELKRRIDEFATHEPEAPAPSNHKTYYCSVCHKVPVDAENGFDTCSDCVSKI